MTPRRLYSDASASVIGTNTSSSTTSQVLISLAKGKYLGTYLLRLGFASLSHLALFSGLGSKIVYHSLQTKSYSNPLDTKRACSSKRSFWAFAAFTTSGSEDIDKLPIAWQIKPVAIDDGYLVLTFRSVETTSLAIERIWSLYVLKGIPCSSTPFHDLIHLVFICDILIFSKRSTHYI